MQRMAATAFSQMIVEKHWGAVRLALTNYFGMKDDGQTINVTAKASAENVGIEVRFVGSPNRDESGEPLPDGSQPYSAHVIDLEANREAPALPHPGHCPPPFNYEIIGDTPKAEIPLTESKPQPAATPESLLPKAATRRYDQAAPIHPEVIRDQSYRLPDPPGPRTELDLAPEPKRSSSGGFTPAILAGQFGNGPGLQWGGKWRGPKPSR